MALEKNNLQYLRTCSLIVADNATNGLDLSQLRIKFSVKRSDTPTPNTADIRVYNVELQTALRIRKEFTRVILQAGYEGNYGVIFSGNIKQVLLARESATDTYIDIIAGDGDRAYNYAMVNKSLAAGSTLSDQINTVADSMSEKGVTLGYVADQGQTKLPRGKVLFGNGRNYLRNAALTSNSAWSIQNEKIIFVANKGYLPGTQVDINSTTGMIGAPQQTNDGVNVKTLLNPNIQISGRIKLDNSTIIQQKLSLEQIAAAKGDTKLINGLIPRNLNANGSYYVLAMEHQGDTRGLEWYTNLVCLNIDVSTNPLNSVSLGANNG